MVPFTALYFPQCQGPGRVREKMIRCKQSFLFPPHWNARAGVSTSLTPALVSLSYHSRTTSTSSRTYMPCNPICVYYLFIFKNTMYKQTFPMLHSIDNVCPAAAETKRRPHTTPTKSLSRATDYSYIDHRTPTVIYLTQAPEKERTRSHPVPRERPCGRGGRKNTGVDSREAFANWSPSLSSAPLPNATRQFITRRIFPMPLARPSRKRNVLPSTMYSL